MTPQIKMQAGHVAKLQMVGHIHSVDSLKQMRTVKGGRLTGCTVHPLQVIQTRLQNKATIDIYPTVHGVLV
jgi:hypothetical protein